MVVHLIAAGSHRGVREEPASSFADYVCVFDAYRDLLSSLVASGAPNTSLDPASFGAQWGYFADSGENLELLGHRYYDEESGRFVTRDPIGYAGSINVYQYCGARPVNRKDPYGYFSIWEGMGSCVVAVGLTAALFSGSGTCIGGEGCQEIGDCLSALVGVAVGGTVAGGCGASVVASAGSFLSTCVCGWVLPCAPKCNVCTAIGDAVSAALGCVTGGISIGSEGGDTVVQTVLGGGLGAGFGGLIGRFCDAARSQ